MHPHQIPFHLWRNRSGDSLNVFRIQSGKTVRSQNKNPRGLQCYLSTSRLNLVLFIGRGRAFTRSNSIAARASLILLIIVLDILSII